MNTLPNQKRENTGWAYHTILETLSILKINIRSADPTRKRIINKFIDKLIDDPIPSSYDPKVEIDSTT